MKNKRYLVGFVFAFLFSSLWIACFAKSVPANAASVDFAQGDGTIESPFVISTVEEFDRIRYHRDAYFVQKGNLDFSSKENFAPIGSASYPFTGFYDGKKYSLTNLTICYPDKTNVGVFGFLFGGEIKDVKIHSAEVIGAYNVGSIVGVNRGALRGIINGADVTGKNNVGGIAGLNSNRGVIEECGNLGKIVSENDAASGMYAGGIAGSNFYSIKNSYNQGDVNSNRSSGASSNSIYSGGIAGLNNGEKTDAVIEKVYNTGDIDGAAQGQIVGDNLDGKIFNSKWLSQKDKNSCFAFNSDESGVADNEPITQELFGDKNTFDEWQDFSINWMYSGENTFPILKREYVKIENIYFHGGNQVKLMPGEVYEIKPVVLPIHSTIRTAKIHLTAKESNVQEFDENSNKLTISENAKIGDYIYVKAEEEGVEALLAIEIIKIPVERVEIRNDSGVNTISAARSLRFGAEVYPGNASDKTVRFTVNSSFASISENGELTVKDETPVGTKIIVSAVSRDNPNAYSSLEVVTVKVTVDEVKLTAEESFKVTESLELTGEVLPAKATNRSIVYTIVSATAQGAKIEGNILTAKGLGFVTIIGEVDGVKSAPVTVQAVKEPVDKIEFLNADKMKCGENLLLETQVSPHNATFSSVEYEIVENFASATLLNGVITAKSDGSVLVRATADGITADLNIAVEKIAVEKINILFGKAFKHTESLDLKIEVVPRNATYKTANYSILRDNANAKIENGKLYAEKPGTIDLAIEVDGIKETSHITVLKEAVTKINLTATSVESDNGEAWQFNAEIFPNNATNRECAYYLNSGNATLSQDGLLVININNPVGSLIEVYAVADGIESEIYKIYSGKVAVKEVKLSANSASTKVGLPVDLSVTTVPALVSNPNVTFRVIGNGEVVDGQFFVFDASAAGTTAEVIAYVDNVASRPVKIRIDRTPVESIVIHNATSMKVTEGLQLSATAFPVTATDRKITFRIVSGLQIGAKIENGYLTASKVGTVVIRATADGVTKDFGVKVTKEPVTDVILTSAKQVKVMQELRFVSNVYPAHATNKKVSYEIVGDNSIGAELYDGNCFICFNVGKVTVRVSADDIYRDYEIEVLKEPVTTIVFNGQKTLKHTERLKLSAMVLPNNATYREVRYEISANGINARIENGYLYADKPGEFVLKMYADEISTEVTITVVKEAVVDIRFESAEGDVLVLDKGTTHSGTQVKAGVYPFNATENNIVFEIESHDPDIEAVITSDGFLTFKLLHVKTLNGYAALSQGFVKIKASADGVSKTLTYDIHKNPVLKDAIKLNKQKTYDILPVDGVTNWISTTENEFKTSEKMMIEPTFNEFATFTEYSIGILNNQAEANYDSGSRVLTAKKVGKFSVEVTSLCNGDKIVFDFNATEEPVVTTYLGIAPIVSLDPKIPSSEFSELPKSQNYDDTKAYKLYTDITLKQEQEIQLRPFSRGIDASAKSTHYESTKVKIYYSLDNGITKIPASTTNDYFTFDGSALRIKSTAKVGAVIELYAVFQHSEMTDCASENYEIVSAKTAITVRSKYYESVRDATIKDGKIDPGGGLEGVKSATVTVSNDKLRFTKQVATSNGFVTIRMNMAGTFHVDYSLDFHENDTDFTLYSETIKMMGSSAAMDGEVSFSENVVVVDYSNGAPKSNQLSSSVQAMYVYSNSSTSRNTCFEIGNGNTEVDLYLNRFSFYAPANKDAIGATGSGKLKLTTLGNVTVKGGNGTDGANGADCPGIAKGAQTPQIGGEGQNGTHGGDAIKAANLDLSIAANSSVTLRGGIGGQGGNGGRGQNSDIDGYGTNHDGSGSSAGAGGRGGNGGSGGSAIDITWGLHITASQNSQLDLYGGNAKNGGRGGNGGDGENNHKHDNGGNAGDGGRGGMGGDGIYCSSLTIDAENSFTINITSGIGGYGGDGGTGGGSWNLFGSSVLGHGGNGGRGGNTGNGIVATSRNINPNVVTNFFDYQLRAAGGSAGGENSFSGSSRSHPIKPVNGSRGDMGQTIRAR